MKPTTDSGSIHIPLNDDTKRHIQVLRDHYAREGIHLLRVATIRMAVARAANQVSAADN